MGLSLRWASGRGEKRRAERCLPLPCRIATRDGAQVAPQRCLILLTSVAILPCWQGLVFGIECGLFFEINF